MNQALDKQAILDHYRGELSRFSPKGVEQFQPAHLVKVCGDPRLAEIVTLFESADDRGKECLYRLARAMPCCKGVG